MDLIELIRGRRWAKLGRLVGQLPARSRWRTAIALDEEAVSQMLDSGEDTRASRPGLDEWSLTAALLAEAVDRIGQIPAAIYRAAGDTKSQPPKPYPRPVTAVERVQQQRSWARHASLVEEVKAAQQRNGGGGHATG